MNAPGQVWDTKKARVQAVIAGYHTPAAQRNVSLVVAGKTIATKPVNVPAEGRATVEFESLEVPYGFARCEVRIDSADTLPDDDVARFAVERTDPKHVLFVHEPTDSRSELYFRSALVSAAESAFTIDSVPVNQVSNIQPTQAQYAFVVLSDLLSVPVQFESALKNMSVRAAGSGSPSEFPALARQLFRYSAARSFKPCLMRATERVTSMSAMSTPPILPSRKPTAGLA